MIFNHELNNGILTIYLEGAIDSTNCADLEARIAPIVSSVPHTGLRLDFAKVSYISSAGLRLVLKLRKSCEDFAVIEANNEIYDIFDMTGFTNILQIYRKAREVSIANCPLIGNGAYGRVYRINDDTIVKSYFRGNPIAEIERERQMAQAAFVLGIPTAISYDVVKVVEENCFGAVYELIKADSLMQCFMGNPDDYDKYLKEYHNLLVHLSKTKVEGDQIPDCVSDLKDRLDYIKPHLNHKTYEKIEKMVLDIAKSKGFVHGDCHFKNIFMVDGQLILIDMDTICKGPFILEIANIYRTYCAFEEITPGDNLHFLGVDGKWTKKLYTDLFNLLFGKKPNPDKIQSKIRFLAFTLLLSHYVQKPEKYAKMIEKTLAIVESELPQIDNLEIPDPD